MIPLGLNLTSIGVSSAWWLESTRRAEEAGFSAVWCWDHFISRGSNKASPVLECWTTLTAAAALTRRARVGSFVTNVMNRHPAVLARMLATLADQSAGRVELGLGVGGYGTELEAYGIPFPEPAERVARLEEAVTVLRLLWSGGPADFEGRFFRLREAWAQPVPSPAPRIIVGGEKPAGARLAARVGDGWTTNAPDYERLLPIHRAELEAHGRRRSEVAHLVALGLARDEPLDRQPLIADMAGLAAEWAERGADELIVNWVRPHELPALLEAAERAGLAG
ncbi:MAG TPA: LLM class flavin-dependent oxidoreductase [Candidatus Limnocylindria bacterium]|nr:LLM class flavin-dependent oxidoreductase [Candidatus Limnocylindria bacterium]